MVDAVVLALVLVQVAVVVVEVKEAGTTQGQVITATKGTLVQGIAGVVTLEDMGMES